MKVQLDDVTAVKKSLTIEIPAAAVSKAFSKAYMDLNRQVKVPGFRPGKVPMSILKKRYGSAVEDDIKRDLIPDFYEQAIEETGIFPVDYPAFGEIELSNGAPLVFTATVEIKPSFKLGEYRGIVLPQQEVEISKEDLDKALSAKQEQAGQLEACDDEHEIVSMDFAILNFEGELDGAPVADGKQEGFTIQVGSKSFPPPFESELLGKKKGDALDVAVPYPDDFQNKLIAGKTVNFHVEIQEVKKKVLPELDDEFAKDLEYETLEDLRKETKETLLKQATSKQEQDQKKVLVDKLIALHPFEIPSSMVARELNTILGSFPDQNALGEDAEKKEAFMKELEPLARKRVAETLLLSAIAEKEEIEITDEAIEKEIAAIAERRGSSLKETKRAFHKKDGALEGLKGQMKENQALDLIYGQAKFETVAVAEVDTTKGEKS